MIVAADRLDAEQLAPDAGEGLFDLTLGRLVRVKTSAPIRGLHVIVGKLKEFDGKQIVVTDPKMKKDPDYVVPMAEIKETRLEVEI